MAVDRFVLIQPNWSSGRRCARASYDSCPGYQGMAGGTLSPVFGFFDGDAAELIEAVGPGFVNRSGVLRDQNRRVFGGNTCNTSFTASGSSG